jgi:site-specific recombinase XerD
VTLNAGWGPPEPAAALDQVLAAYLKTLASRPHTLRAYGRHLRNAFRDLAAAALEDLAPWRLEAWRETLLQDGRSPATHAQVMSALRSFLDWVSAQLDRDLPRAVLRALKIPKRKVLRPYEVLSEAELEALLAAAAGHPRDRALLAVLLGAGLRASEAVALDVQDFRLDSAGGWYLHVRQGKGGRDRRVPLRLAVAAAVRAYLDATGRPLRAGGALFLGADRAAISRADLRMSPRALGYLVQRYVRPAGIAGKHISPHACRHTFALRALRGGSDLVAVSKLLGHAQVTTTQVYLDHLAMEDLRGALPDLPL